MNNSETKWQTDSSSRVVWQCPVLPLVTRARAYRSQTWSSKLVYDLPILWSPLLPSLVRLLCSHLQLSSNLFANKNSIAKQRCHSKEKQKTQLLEHNVQPQSLAILLLFALLSAQGAARQVRLPPMGPLRCVLSTRLPAFPRHSPGSLPEAGFYHRTSEGTWRLLTSGRPAFLGLLGFGSSSATHLPAHLLNCPGFLPGLLAMPLPTSGRE